MAKKDKLKSYKMERRELHDKVINFFNTEENVPYNYKQVSEKVDANTPRLRAMVVELLEQLAIDGFLAEVTPGRFKRAFSFAAAMAKTVLIPPTTMVALSSWQSVTQCTPSMATVCWCISVRHAKAWSLKPR